MNLHGKIMNLQAPDYTGLLAAPDYAAKIGHRDARHAAAELALAADAELEALRKDAERYRWLLAHAVGENDDGEKCIYYWCDFEHYNDVSASIDAAMKEQP